MKAYNFPNMLEKEWMLITAGSDQKVNTMTAGWGGFGILWEKPCVFIFVRPQRYTYEFTERENYFSLNFFENEKKMLSYLGTVSGRDEEKIANANLNIEFQHNTPYFREAKVNILCKKVYRDILREENFLFPEIHQKWYPKKDYHIVYIGEILGIVEGGEE